jgi:large conductance mechanosensitive channel
VLKGFRDFVLRGNVVDLAVAVVIGTAFGLVVAAFVTDLITPLVGIPGKIDFASATFTINGSVFRYGAFINAVIAFVLVAAAIYLAVVSPMNRIMARRAKPAADVPTRECPACVSSIAKKATRCPYCTTMVDPV